MATHLVELRIRPPREEAVQLDNEAQVQVLRHGSAAAMLLGRLAAASLDIDTHGAGCGAAGAGIVTQPQRTQAGAARRQDRCLCGDAPGELHGARPRCSGAAFPRQRGMSKFSDFFFYARPRSSGPGRNCTQHIISTQRASQRDVGGSQHEYHSSPHTITKLHCSGWLFSAAWSA